MLVQSVAGYKLARLSQLLQRAFPSPPCTLFVLILLTVPSPEAVFKISLDATVSGYNTRMGWVQFP